MNEEIIGIEVSGEIYPIKDEETSGKAQTLETKVSTAEENITNLETASTEHGEKIAQIEANIGETDIQELKSLVDSLEEEIKELVGLIDDTTISEFKTWSSEKINESSVKKIGDLTELKTINKSNLVSAINEISQSSSGNVYSTDEVIIGTWIDGKPLYRKAGLVKSNVTANVNATVTIPLEWFNTNAISTVDKIIELRTGQDGHALISTWRNVGINATGVQALNGSGTGYGMTATTVAVVEYTKTTD